MEHEVPSKPGFLCMGGGDILQHRHKPALIDKHRKTSFEKNTVLSAPTKDKSLETSATHHIPQAKNISYQPLLIKLVFLSTSVWVLSNSPKQHRKARPRG